jgi:hypothetical protein
MHDGEEKKKRSNEKKDTLIYTKVDFIRGPEQITEIRLASPQKHFYLFSDIHERDAKCQDEAKYHIENIDTFLVNTLLQNPKKTIDLFLEQDYITFSIRRGEKYAKERKLPQQHLKEQGFLFWDVSIAFNKCLQIVKKDCSFRNGRFHYTDVRTFFRSFQTLYITLKYLEHMLRLVKIDRDTWNDKLSLLELAYGILIEDKWIVVDKWNFQTIFDSLKITKQIKNIQDANIKKLLRNFFVTDGIIAHSTDPQEIHSLLFDLRSQQDNYLKSEDKQFQMRLRVTKVREGLSLWRVWFMDTYLMARCFRHFMGIMSTIIYNS